jgi:hypothetical protein
MPDVREYDSSETPPPPRYGRRRSRSIRNPQPGDVEVFDPQYRRYVPQSLASGGGGGAAHPILGGHSDSLQDTPSAGSLIVGSTGSPSLWDELLKGDEGEDLTVLNGVVQWYGGGGIIHYDFVVDANSPFTDGTELTTKLGSTIAVYTTIQAAFDDCVGRGNGTTIYICAGTYEENVTTPSLGADDHVHFIGESKERVRIDPSSGTAFDIGDTSPEYHFDNITFGGTGYSMLGSASTIQAHVANCVFEAPVSADWETATFTHCVFESGFQIDASHSPDRVRFQDCSFTNSSQVTWAGNLKDFYFVNCRFDGSSRISATASTITNLVFTGCDINPADTGTAKTFFTRSASGGGTTLGLAFNGCNMGQPDTNGCVYIASIGTTNQIRITNCSFVASGTNPYVQSDDADAILVMTGNILSSGPTYAVTGSFSRLVFGPNFPFDAPINVNALGSGGLYVGTGTISGAAATAMRHPAIQTGTAAPTHSSTEGQLFWDATNNKLYVNTDGSTTWAEIALASSIITDHGALTGLTDDDHTQYLKEKASGGAASEVPEHTHASSSEAGTVPLANTTVSGGTDGHFLKQTGATTFAWEADYYTVSFIISGGGSAITTGIKGWVELPSSGVLEEWRILLSASDTMTVDIDSDTYANFPTVGNDLVAPAVSGAQKAEATGLSTAVTAEDILEFNVTVAPASAQTCTVALKIRKT